MGVGTNHRTLADLCELIVDCEHKTAPTQSTGYPSIRTPNIGRGRLILEGVNRVSQETYEKWTRRAVPQGGDLILAREAPAGNVAIVPDNLRVCLGQRTVLIRPDKSKVDADYLVYYLLDAPMQARLLAHGAGATVAHINMSDIRSLKIPELPDIQTQQRIGGILSAYDDLIENNTRRIKILEEMAQAIYREWFVEFRAPGVELRTATPEEKKLTGKDQFPKGWEVACLQEALVLQRGFDLPKREREIGDIPIYASTGINGTHSVAKVKGPGIVTGRSGSLGTVIYIETDFWPLNTTLWVKEFRKATPIYAFYLLNQLKLGSYNSGAAVPTLNRNDVHSNPVVVPSELELKKFDDNILLLFQLKSNLVKCNDNLRRTRDLLLPKLISGEVGVDGIEPK